MRINTFATMPFERASNSLKVLHLLSACSVIPPSPPHSDLYEGPLKRQRVSPRVSYDRGNIGLSSVPASKEIEKPSLERVRWLAERDGDPAHAGKTVGQRREEGTFDPLTLKPLLRGSNRQNEHRTLADAAQILIIIQVHGRWKRSITLGPTYNEHQYHLHIHIDA